MTKTSASKRGARADADRRPSIRRGAGSDRAVGKSRVEAVMQAAERSGFLDGKGGRIGGRVSPALIRQAKRRSGIEADTDLIEFALAAIALEDDFARTFKQSRGKIDSELKLGY